MGLEDGFGKIKEQAFVAGGEKKKGGRKKRMRGLSRGLTPSVTLFSSAFRGEKRLRIGQGSVGEGFNSKGHENGSHKPKLARCPTLQPS